MPRKSSPPFWFYLTFAVLSVFIPLGVDWLLNPPLGKYARAQSQTVLVESADGYGSGFVIERTSPDGGKRFFVWTAAHVVRPPEPSYKIKLFIRKEGHKVGITEFTATLLESDHDVDAALLWVDCPEGYLVGTDFSSMLLPSVGTPVYSVGNYHGPLFDSSVATGIIAQLGVQNHGVIEDWRWPLVDQMTAPCYPGSSGGPVFMEDGKIAGMAVGRIPEENIFVYLPLRMLNAWAYRAGIQWAITGTECPADEVLAKLGH